MQHALDALIVHQKHVACSNGTSLRRLFGMYTYISMMNYFDFTLKLKRCRVNIFGLLTFSKFNSHATSE